MYVRNYMHTGVIAVPPKTPLVEAQRMMYEHKIRRLPVVDSGKLVGLLTEGKIRHTLAPYTGGTLSTWQFNYALSKMTVEDAMEKDVITVTPDMPVEDGVALGQKHQIGTLPVVDSGKLVGIVTITDLTALMNQVLGFDKPGIRFHIINCAPGESLRTAIGVIQSHKADIQTLFSFSPPGSKKVNTIIRTDPVAPAKVVEDLKKLGFEVEVMQK